jgi:hypothetical protein
MDSLYGYDIVDAFMGTLALKQANAFANALVYERLMLS